MKGALQTAVTVCFEEQENLLTKGNRKDCQRALVAQLSVVM